MIGVPNTRYEPEMNPHSKNATAGITFSLFIVAFVVFGIIMVTFNATGDAIIHFICNLASPLLFKVTIMIPNHAQATAYLNIVIPAIHVTIINLNYIKEKSIKYDSVCIVIRGIFRVGEVPPL